MRMTPHSIKHPTWSESDYGEPTATYGSAQSIAMQIGWVSSGEADKNNAIYQAYQFVGITRANPPIGSLVDDKYVIGHIEHSKLNRCFMNYAEGVTRPTPTPPTPVEAEDE